MTAPSLTPPTSSALSAIFNYGADAIISADRSLRIIIWNPAAERMFGFSASEILGHPIETVLPTDGSGLSATAFRQLIAKGGSLEVESRGRTRSGMQLLVTCTAAAIDGETGEVAGVACVVRELAGGERAERIGRRLAAIVESSDDAIISKDLNGIVTSWNGAAERIFGYPASEMIGQSIRRIVPADRQSEEDEVLARIRSGQKVDHFETVRQRKDGTPVEISLTVSPIRDATGAVIGASKVARDITERRRVEAERMQLFAALEEQSRLTNTLNDVGRVVASTLERENVVQAVTDAATAVTGAEFGAFFYNTTDEQSRDSYQLYALSGAPADAFASFPHPRVTAIFAPTFRGEGIVRLDDVTKDPRYGRTPPHHGMPPGHLPVRSYLAAPVTARSGAVIGGLLFGHHEASRFTAQHERLLEGIASWAAVALENAALYVSAQAANRLKDEFIATLSHELRTPLNAILGYTRMVRAGLMKDEKQERALASIERNADALTRIVEDVLDISRIMAGKLRLRVQQVELRSVVSAALDAVIPAADAKGVRLERVLQAPDVLVSGDPDRLQQVVWNLLSNAVKYTPPGGRVQVSLLRVNTHAEVIVSDTGIGIPADFLPHVFERFRQADGGISRERGGLGLGLAISKDLVELHGGMIEAASAGASCGSTFRVKLPVAAARPMPDGTARVHPEMSDRPPRIVVPDLGGVRIMVVDDEVDARRLVREILEVTGAIVETAGSGEEALQSLALAAVDVVVADLGMPRMDGYQFVLRLRQHPDERLRQIPAAALTAYGRPEDRILALQSGFQLHLSKPIEPAELMAAVAALARGHAPRTP
jgi:PAS domain S-box-containing protein